MMASDYAFLWPAPGADWIVCDRPLSLHVRQPGETFARFRTSFESGRMDGPVPLKVYAFRESEILLDGRVLLAPGQAGDSWRSPRQIDLAPVLAPGRHELMIVVRNVNAPPALAAASAPLGIATGPQWQARCSTDWTQAAVASQPLATPLAGQFPSVAASFLFCLPVWIAVCAGAIAWSRWGRARLDPNRLRWALLAGWALLALNNIVKFPVGLGHDVAQHMDYVRIVAEQWRIPLATEGWQMFQSPLYYLICAPFYLLFSALMTPSACEQALRFIPLACAAAQVELCLRCLKRVYPQRPDLQCVGILIGGMLPMNIWIAQAVGNEPLTAALSGLCVLISVGWLCSRTVPTTRSMAAAGLALGLAMLSKVTAVLLVLPMLAAAGLRLPQARRARGLAALSAAAAAVCGWYYARNWVLLGRPFIGGWDAGRGIVWWQDPGYRTLRDFFSFGASLRQPIYAGLNGFWDSLYSTFWLDGNLSSAVSYDARPPWNYRLMSSGAWWGLLPTAAMIAGFGRGLLGRGGRATAALRWSGACVVLYLTALAAMYLIVPAYASGKATYISGLTPALALLAAAGFDALPRDSRIRTAAAAGLCCWAASAYAAYFIL
jgi:hypothetical protein